MSNSYGISNNAGHRLRADARMLNGRARTGWLAECAWAGISLTRERPLAIRCRAARTSCHWRSRRSGPRNYTTLSLPPSIRTRAAGDGRQRLPAKTTLHDRSTDGPISAEADSSDPLECDTPTGASRKCGRSRRPTETKKQSMSTWKMTRRSGATGATAFPVWSARWLGRERGSGWQPLANDG